MKTKVIAGIVTFNPNIKRLKENVNAISPQVEKILVVDNGSENIKLIDQLKCDKIIVFANKMNIGIAAALNQVMEYAYQNAYNWVITLDQDSITPDKFIDDSSTHFNTPNVAQIVPIIYDENVKVYYDLGTKIDTAHFQEVKKSITSASITNVTIWKEIGKFDSDLFIDYVDYDYCMKINLNGYKILRNNKRVLFHELGSSEMRRFLFFKIRVSNHSSFRKYYIARNIVIFIKRYKHNSRPFAELLRLLKVILLTIFYEKNKLNKLKKISKGILDGMKS
ncbi:glycosyltransferase family 2 protein [Streptococcus hyovaginalis]